MERAERYFVYMGDEPIAECDTYFEALRKMGNLNRDRNHDPYATIKTEEVE